MPTAQTPGSWNTSAGIPRQLGGWSAAYGHTNGAAANLLAAATEAARSERRNRWRACRFAGLRSRASRCGHRDRSREPHSLGASDQHRWPSAGPGRALHVMRTTSRIDAAHLPANGQGDCRSANAADTAGA
jgi:hypothetical protein